MGTKLIRTTVYLDPDLHQALRQRSAESEQSVSELVNKAIRMSLTEDAHDLAAFEERSSEPDIPFEKVVRDLRRRGKL